MLCVAVSRTSISLSYLLLLLLKEVESHGGLYHVPLLLPRLLASHLPIRMRSSFLSVSMRSHWSSLNTGPSMGMVNHLVGLCLAMGFIERLHCFTKTDKAHSFPIRL
jgi:hypothetical protein